MWKYVDNLLAPLGCKSIFEAINESIFFISSSGNGEFLDRYFLYRTGNDDVHRFSITSQYWRKSNKKKLQIYTSNLGFVSNIRNLFK